MSKPNRNRFAVTIVVGTSVVFGVATHALAHSVNKRFGDFYGGMLHPLTAMEHLLPIIGLGLLAGQQGTKQARWVLLLFATGMLTGAVVSGYVEPISFVAWFNRFSLIAVGILVAFAARLPFPLLAATALLLGLSHGYENTADISTAVATYLFVPGVVASGIALVAVVAAIAVSRQAPWQRVAVRVVGSWIAAIGLLVISVA